MPEIINNQRKFKLEWETFQNFAVSLTETIEEVGNKAFTVAFVSDRKMRQMNRRFRGNGLTTDVLSFPFEADEFDIADGNLGEIAISLDQAERQAFENDLSLEIEIKQLILHGVLHLCGYDHESDEGEMNRRELKLREILKI